MKQAIRVVLFLLPLLVLGIIPSCVLSCLGRAKREAFAIARNEIRESGQMRERHGACPRTK